MAYHYYHRVDTKIARIFNIYGPKMRKNDERAVPTFLNQAIKGKPLTVFGDGSQTRSFCYVSDLVEGIYRLMRWEGTEPINLGNPNEMTILEFARKIIELTDSRSKLVYKSLPENDPRVRRPDITRAREHLKWEPKVEMEEGLKRTLDWFKEATIE